MNPSPIRIAIWSGPRNISTALMRAWENRDDTFVHDEPLYANYLLRTGIEHPGREEIIGTYATDWVRVVEQISQAPLPTGDAIYYQKQMAHHLPLDQDLSWMLHLRNGFLIRNPSEVITSYRKVRPDLTLDDLGFPQQIHLYQYLTDHLPSTPPIIDARDVLTDPERILRSLCEALDVPFSKRMLSWPAGPRESDGIWSRFWYRSVEASTGFAPYQPKDERPPAEYGALLEEAMAIYTQLHQQRIH